MENKVLFEVTREYVEQLLGTELTDKHWTVMADEIIDLLDHYLNAEVPTLYDDIDSITEEYDEYIRNS